MGDTFNGLALMDIHSDNDVGAIDLDNVLNRFDSTCHLRIGRVFTDTVVSGVGSNLQVGGGTMPAQSEIFLMCPPLFSCAPPHHMRGHNDCLLPTERQLK